MKSLLNLSEPSLIRPTQQYYRPESSFPGFDINKCYSALISTRNLLRNDPEHYLFQNVYIPDENGWGCIVGWIGYHLGFPPKQINYVVANFLGYKSPTKMYEIFREGDESYTFHGIHASIALRHFTREYMKSATHDGFIPYQAEKCHAEA